MAQKINIKIDVKQIQGSYVSGKVEIEFVEEGCSAEILINKYGNRYTTLSPFNRSRICSYNGNFDSKCRIVCYKGKRKIGELLVYFNTQPPFKYSKQDAILFSCNKEIAPL